MIELWMLYRFKASRIDWRMTEDAVKAHITKLAPEAPAAAIRDDVISTMTELKRLAKKSGTQKLMEAITLLENEQ